MMEFIGTLITGISAILAVVLSNLASNRQVSRKLDKLEKHDREQYLDILKIITMSENMPIEERLIAGKRYIDEGGNGAIKAYYEKLKKEHTK